MPTQQNTLSEINNVTLCNLLSESFVLRLWVATRILLKKFPSLRAAIGEAQTSVTGLDEAKIAQLYRIHPKEKPLIFLWELAEWGKRISHEMSRRTEQFKSREIIRYKLKKPGAPWLAPLLFLTETDQIKTKRPHLEDDEDLALLAITAVEKCHLRLGQDALRMLDPKLPMFPNPSRLDLPEVSPEDSALIDRCFERILKKGTQITLRDFLPILNGQLEQAAPAAARGALRSHWRKQKRRERMRRVGVDLDSIGATDIDLSQNLALKRIFLEASRLKRSGPKAVKALQFLLAGYSEKEAAKLAGMTPRNLRYTIENLRNRLQK